MLIRGMMHVPQPGVETVLDVPALIRAWYEPGRTLNVYSSIQVLPRHRVYGPVQSVLDRTPAQQVSSDLIEDDTMLDGWARFDVYEILVALPADEEAA